MIPVVWKIITHQKSSPTLEGPAWLGSSNQNKDWLFKWLSNPLNELFDELVPEIYWHFLAEIWRQSYYSSFENSWNRFSFSTVYCIYAFANKLGVQNFTAIICVMQGRLASFEPRRQDKSWHHIKLKKKEGNSWPSYIWSYILLFTPLD